MNTGFVRMIADCPKAWAFINGTRNVRVMGQEADSWLASLPSEAVVVIPVHEGKTLAFEWEFTPQGELLRGVEV